MYVLFCLWEIQAEMSYKENPAGFLIKFNIVSVKRFLSWSLLVWMRRTREGLKSEMSDLKLR